MTRLLGCTYALWGRHFDGAEPSAPLSGRPTTARVSRALCCFVLLAFAPLLLADLASVKTEPNLERRSELALDEADQYLEAARTAYNAANDKGFKDSLQEVREAVELSYRSLKDTGKSARKHPKYFKRADLRLRELLRHIEGLEHDVGFDERQVVTSVKNRVSEVDDQIVLDIMKK